MNETKQSETKPKKMVSRNVAIALGIVCIILVAGLGVVMYMSYSPTSVSSIASLQNQINQLQTWLDGNKTLLSQTQTWLAGNITAYNSLQSNYQNEVNQYNAYVADHHHTDEQYTNLQNIVNIADSTIWVNDQTVSEPAGGFGIAWNDWAFSASYAGIVTIDVLSSTTGAWTHVVYSAYGVNYNVQINVGTSGTAYFPVLPSSSITVGVGNGNLNSGATETVTITYYY